MPIITPQENQIIAPGTDIQLSGGAVDADPETRRPPRVVSVTYQVDGGSAQPLAHTATVSGPATHVTYDQSIGALGAGNHVIAVTVEFSLDTTEDSVTLTVAAPPPPLLARLGGKYAPLVNEQAQATQGLVGLVDLHTHPAAHLGFGTEMFYGPPDGDPSENFNSCDPYHGPWNPIVNPEGNDIRQIIVDSTAGEGFSGNWDHQRPGWPDFPAWPTWHDRLHQQVRVEMLERAWKGGLRLIVALANNSHTLGVLGRTKGPWDDKAAGDAQIAAIRDMVSGQDFMGLALSPSDVRRIIGSGKLAVVIGLELDCIGNFYQPDNVISGGTVFNPNPSDDDIRAEIRRLFAAGVRYFFPVHLVDNIFGGCALYDMAFDTACRYQTGAWIAAETAPAASDIDFAFNGPQTFWQYVMDTLQRALVIESLGFDPDSYPTPPPPGNRNCRGLQDRGRVALDELIRLGALIDVDHMGEKTVHDTLQHTAAVNYPLFAGHNGIRKLPNGNERSHLLKVAVQILNRGGMYGAYLSDGLPGVRETIDKIRHGDGVSSPGTPNGGIALGSDSSGLAWLPSPRNAGDVVYSDEPSAPAGALQRCHLGRRAEDINTAGFPHVGMFPDFIEEGVSSGLLTDSHVTELFNAPERFVSAWQVCLARRPVAYLTDFPGQGPMARVVDRSSAGDAASWNGTLGHIAELSYPGRPGWWAANDLNAVAFPAQPPPAAAGPPFAYSTNFPPDEGPTARVVYQAAADGHIWELSYTGPPGTWGMNDLTKVAGGPPAADTPHGYATNLAVEGPAARVVYWGVDGHIWEFVYSPDPQRGGWGANDLTRNAGGPLPAGRPFGYVTGFPGQEPMARVIYQGTDGHIWELSYPGHTAWGVNDLTRIAGGSPAADRPFGYVADIPGQPGGAGLRARVIYQGTDGRIWELNYPGPPGQWTADNLTLRAEQPGMIPGPAAGSPHCYLSYFAGQGLTARVIYQGTDGHIWELNYSVRVGGWGASDLTAISGGPPAAGPPYGYVTDFPNEGPTARVVYKSTDGHVWELSYPGPAGDWWATDLARPATTVPNVVGETPAKARTPIAAAQLKMQVEYDSPLISAETYVPIIESQSPDGGQVVGVGSVVVVTVKAYGGPKGH